MKLRRYMESDCPELARLFYETVHSVCVGDYTEEQVQAWASGDVDLERWNRKYLESYTAVCEEKDTIIGFGNITDTGYLDMLFVHRDHQGKGIASAICSALEESCRAERITVNASITAKPFFERRGYRVVREQQIERKGVILTNFAMEKDMR